MPPNELKSIEKHLIQISCEKGISGRRTTSSSRKETTSPFIEETKDTETPKKCISPIIGTPNAKSIDNYSEQP